MRELLVKEFHEKMQQSVGVKNPDLDLLSFRYELLFEEMMEVKEEVANLIAAPTNTSADKARARLLKELADLQYVLSGFAVTLGLPLEEAFLRVHRSNLSKLGLDGKPIYREDGKVLKSPNYQPPYMEDLV